MHCGEQYSLASCNRVRYLSSQQKCDIDIRTCETCLIEAQFAFDFELAKYRVAVAAEAAVEALLADTHTRRSRRTLGGCSVYKPERDVQL